jgi:hypothetical protein
MTLPPALKTARTALRASLVSSAAPEVSERLKTLVDHLQHLYGIAPAADEDTGDMKRRERFARECHPMPMRRSQGKL